MRLDNQLYLVLERSDTDKHRDKHRVRIARNLGQALLSWKASTRISPIYSVTFDSEKSSQKLQLGTSYTLLLIGPVHPVELIVPTEPSPRLWVGYGLLNVLIVPTSEQQKRRLLQFARSKKIVFEVWHIKNGIIERVEHDRTGKIDKDVGLRLSSLSNRSFLPEVKEAVSEYCPLMASTLSRSYQLPANMRENLLRTQDYVDATVKDSSRKDAMSVTPYRLLGQMLTLNAGLSRFSSQTFAGTVPVSETECHFWSHSLLGIGIASIGLCKITEFIEHTLGRARLPERFALLEEVRTKIPDLRTLDINDDFWTTDHLGRISLEKQEPEPIVPLLSYFSARDGFRSTPTTISAPLASVTSCNSPRWSLLTVTHEITHVVVRAMLSVLYPDFDDSTQVANALELLEQQGTCETLLQEIRRLLLVTIFNMENHGQNKEIDIDSERLTRTVEKWQREIEEILVHVFDFQYFYGKDLDKYISGIWASWGTIPNIATRVPDYVIRSICAALSNNLRRDGGEEIARDSVVESLRRLQKNNIGGKYVEAALQHITAHWKDEIAGRIAVRKELIKIAGAFFFSESIAKSVREERAVSGGASEKEGYKFHPKHLTLSPIRNPLHFLELYGIDTHPSPIDSLWIYYVLTFCVGPQ